MVTTNKTSKTSKTETTAATTEPAPATSTVKAFKLKDRADGRERVEMSGGGSWDGPVWFPHGATDEAKARAAEYGNAIVEVETVEGRLRRGKAFDGKRVFFLQRKTDKLLLPDHGGLMRDLGDTMEEYGSGVDVEIVFRGHEPIKNGEHKGKLACVYSVFLLEDPKGK